MLILCKMIDIRHTLCISLREQVYTLSFGSLTMLRTNQSLHVRPSIAATTVIASAPDVKSSLFRQPGVYLEDDGEAYLWMKICSM